MAFRCGPDCVAIDIPLHVEAREAFRCGPVGVNLLVPSVLSGMAGLLGTAIALGTEASGGLLLWPRLRST